MIWMRAPSPEEQLLVNIFGFIPYILMWHFVKYYIRKAERKLRDTILKLELDKQYQAILEQQRQDVLEFSLRYLETFKIIHQLIESDNMIALRDFFEKELGISLLEITKDPIFSEKISHIKINELRSIILFKSMYAKKFSISVDFDLLSSKNINSINLNTVVLVRILGIFLDNAIEAASESENKAVQIYIYQDSEDTIFIVRNSYLNKPDINRMYEDGYSTKGKDRGFGLTEVRSLIYKLRNIVLFTSCENEEKMFSQELRIY